MPTYSASLRQLVAFYESAPIGAKGESSCQDHRAAVQAWLAETCLAAFIGVVLACTPLASGVVHAQPVVAKQEPIPDEIWNEMQGKSWHPNLGCPSRQRLVLLTVPYRDFADRTVSGQLIVAREVASKMSKIFSDIFASGTFRIERMTRVDAFGGNDDASMAANNTSAFNCRTIAGTTTLSAHASGTAIDINPVQNPFVKGTNTDPPSGRPFDTLAERQAAHAAGQPGIILSGGPVTAAFKRQGWKWGGNWTGKKDYQHFSSDGR